MSSPNAHLHPPRVLIAGMGALGCPAAETLAAGGAARLVLVDFDAVDLGNLHRQGLYGDGDIGRPKTEVAARRLNARFPDVAVEAVHACLDQDNAREILAGHDVIIDGTDNFPAKFLIADACLSLGIPLVHAGVLRWTGQVMTIVPGKTACYRCVFREPPAPGSLPSCAEAGVLGAVAGVVGTLQARHALALLAGRTPPSAGALLVYDGLHGTMRRVVVPPQADCPACAPGEPRAHQAVGEAANGAAT